jgi:aspartate kinase
MTFSRLAVLAHAREAVIHKEFHLSSADPRIVGVDRARKVSRTSFDVADQLANIGMEAIHPGAGRGLRKANIPLRVRNTFERDDPGALICAGPPPAPPAVEIISGVRELEAIEYFEPDMVGEFGHDDAILQTLAKHGAWIVSKASNATSITHYLAADAPSAERIVDDLRAQRPAARVRRRSLSMIAMMGRKLPDASLIARAVEALRMAGVAIAALQHPIQNVDLQIVIARSDFDLAIRTLHAAFIENDLDTVRAA